MTEFFIALIAALPATIAALTVMRRLNMGNGAHIGEVVEQLNRKMDGLSERLDRLSERYERMLDFIERRKNG